MIRSYLILVLIMGACTVLRAQAPSATPEPASGTISGKVVNESGQPLIGASLFVRAMNPGAQSRSTTTDVEGNFRVNSLDPGLYTITASSPAYITEPAPAPNYYRIGDTVQVEMVRGGVITGTVTNALGEPVIDVRVKAVKIRDAKGQMPRVLLTASSERLTDDRGVYRLYGLSAGTYLVSAGGGSGFSPVLYAYESDIPTFSPSSTRDTAAEISVRNGEESTADIRYRGEQGHSISGTVKMSGTNGATITLSSASRAGLALTTFQQPNGRGFVFNGLSDGEYKLMAQEAIPNQSLTAPSLAMSDIARVTVKGANVSGIELLPKLLGSISGRIALEPTKAPECEGKRPPLFAETLVRLQRNEKEVESDDSNYARMSSSSAALDANGAFVLRNLIGGRYQFDTRFYARYWYLQSITLNTTAPKPQKVDAAANWTTLRSGEQLTNFTITLAGGAASIRGRLALTEGNAPAKTFVYLVPFETEKTENVLRFYVTEIGADGTFAFNNLAPGKYLALTQSNVDAQLASLAKLRQPEAATARVKLRRTAETHKNLIELKPCQNVIDYQLKQ